MAPRKTKSKQPLPRSRGPIASSGFSISYKTLGGIATTIGLIAMLWSPVQTFMTVTTKLSTSIEQLADAVKELRSTMTTQGNDITLLKQKVAEFEALKSVRTNQIDNHEQRLQRLEQQR